MLTTCGKALHVPHRIMVGKPRATRLLRRLIIETVPHISMIGRRPGATGQQQDQQEKKTHITPHYGLPLAAPDMNGTA